MNQAPLNYLQRYVLRRQEERPGTSMFNLAKMFRLRRGIDLGRVADALARAGRRHQALRSVLHRFPGGEVLQMMALDEDEIDVEVVKVQERNLLARRSSYVKIFRTYDEGLVDAIIFDCGENAYLLSNIHHLIADGYSFPLILEDARRAWNGETMEEDRYYEILAKQSARAAMPVAVSARRMVSDLLASREFATIPSPDRAGPAGAGSATFPLEVPEDFDKFLASRRISRHHFFLACSAVALSRLADFDDVAVDWVFHGRVTREELSTVGAFMVDLPFPLQDVRSKSPEDILFETRHWTFTGIKYANSVCGMAEECQGAPRLTFNCQEAWGELISPGPVDPDGPYGWLIEETLPLDLPRAMPENPFNVVVAGRNGGLTLSVEYDTGRYSPAVAGRYVELFREAASFLYSRQ